MYVSNGSNLPAIERRVGSGPDGFAVGVLHIPSAFPILPGNPLNASTFDFPVLYECVNSLSAEKVVSGDSACEPALVSAARRLEQSGVRIIVGLCGSFANFQRIVAEAVRIPVFTSILVHTQFILSSLAKDRMLGIVFADERSFTKKIISQCSIEDHHRIRLTDFKIEPEFAALMRGSRTINARALSASFETCITHFMQQNEDLGALMIQCNELATFSCLAQNVTGLPVYDASWLVRSANAAAIQRPPSGFLFGI